ncbi:hypothetical protein [Methylomonas fluvii]|uniref:Uncharacterized protein n=1 Tax=Methylomonas fluvii TaxID=1854564 RepID=A0ABR9DB48_9GAMM|nr:hypothetical protein [Methylomonas fluvii]MBD9360331.1 hypothetical protein [Methylomonas fluvii]
MHSYTSNSSDRLPQQALKRSFLAGMAIAVLLLAVVELRLRQIGFQPTVQDSKELWATERTKAALLGKQALILVGDSRMQLDMDLDVLAAATGLTPVQLAIDGSEFLPVLADLAADDSITGTVLVSGDVWKLVEKSQTDRANEWIDFYHREYKALVAPKLETLLKSRVQQWSALYASGMPASDLLIRLITPGKVRPLYLSTKPNRQRDADYQLVDQPMFYIQRVLRNLGQTVDLAKVASQADFERLVIDALQQSAPTHYAPEQFFYVNRLTDRILERGGKIAFINFPMAGLIFAIDEHRSPREFGWDVFAAHSRAITFNSQDYPALNFALPDGSHLDRRDKQAFTTQLVSGLKAKAVF